VRSWPALQTVAVVGKPEERTRGQDPGSTRTPHLTIACKRRRGARLVGGRRGAVQLPGAPEAWRWVAGRGVVAWRGRGHKQTMFACSRPGVRRGPLRWSGGHLCRSLTPCAMVAAARALSGVRGCRGGPRLRQRCGRRSEHARAGSKAHAGGWCRVTATRGTVAAWSRGAFVLRHERVGGSYAAWWRSAGSGGGGQGSRQRRAPAGPGKRRGASCCRAVVQGTVVPRALHPGALRRVSRHDPRLTGRCGILRPGWRPWGWRQSVTGRPGHLRRSPATQQGFAGDGKQPPLVPRCGSFPRLMRGVSHHEVGLSPPRMKKKKWRGKL
jgi:hypothetical protein